MQIKFHPKHPWRKTTINNLTIYVAGFCDINAIAAALTDANFEALETQLRQEKLQYGVLISGPDFNFAATDRIRSYPIFYDTNTDHVSNHAQDLEQSSIAKSKNADALLSFAMSGYVVGGSTLHTDIKQLQAGEYLYTDKNDTAKIKRYYTYAPHPQNIDKDTALTHLDKAMNTAIENALNIIGDAPIWVPLSGGYDSRIILAKFKEHGAKNLHCFSYGIKGNDEAKTARKIAKILDVPWHMVAAEPHKHQELYSAQIRKDYEAFTHGYTGIPSYVEFVYIKKAKDSGLIPENSFIINGQTGDFISGDHIPAVLYENDTPSQADLLDYTINKHFSLWKNLKTPANIKQLEEIITPLLIPENPDLSIKDNLIAQYESFEWAERQSKMVAQTAQVYSFFGYNWLMPLWHADIMDFFETLPLDLKYNRQLFVDYLKQYNYQGVFDIPKPAIRTWQPHQYWIIAVAKFIEIIHGTAAKQDFYKKMIYHGHRHDQLSFFTQSLYEEHYKNIRNMLSLSILDFLETHKLPFPKA